METVKIVFDIDTKDIKTSTDDLKALNKVTETEIETLKRLEAESNASKVAFSQLSKEIKSANAELVNVKKQFGDASKEAQSAQKNVDSLTDKMAELKNTVKPLDEAFVSLRTQVKLAKEEALQAADKFGEFSKEANAARQKAGLLADQMGDLNRQVGLLNPEAKAKAFSNLGGAVVGAFSVATGALQAFGVKNKEVEELAMKLQGALNIAQGIASFGAMKEALQDVKIVLGFTTVAQEAMTVATEAEAVASTEAAIATKGFTASLLTNPIFLVIAAIAALAGAMILMGDDTEEAKKEIDSMTESQKALRAATNQSAEASDNLLVAQGKLAKSTSDINKANRDNKIAVQDMNEELKKNNAEIEKNNAIIAKENKLIADRIANINKEKSQKQVFKTVKVSEEYSIAVKKNKELAESNNNITKSIKAKNEATKDNIETIKVEKKIADTEKQKQDQKELTDLTKQNAKEREAAAKEQLRLADALRKKLQENALATETDPGKKIQMARQFANEDYAMQLERLQNAKATQDEVDLLSAGHTDTIQKLNTEEVKINENKNTQVLAAEKKLQASLLALALAQETDPLKRAQLINDAKEKEIDDKLALVEKGSTEEQALLADKATAEIEAQKRLGAALIEVNKNTNKDINKTEAEAAAERKAIRDGAFQLAGVALQAYGEAVTRQTDEEFGLLEEQKNKKLINEKEYQRRLKELKNKQAQEQKKLAIYQATLDFSAALINALTFKPFEAVPAALVFASIVAAANLAKIIATPVPRFAKGTLAVPGMDMGRDSVHAMLQPGEAVIPVSTNRAYHPTIKAIYEKKISPSEINNFVMSRTSSGGKQSITANVDTYALGRALGKNKTVEVGNANMIGKAMAQELLRGNNYRRS